MNNFLSIQEIIDIGLMREYARELYLHELEKDVNKILQKENEEGSSNEPSE